MKILIGAVVAAAALALASPVAINSAAAAGRKPKSRVEINRYQRATSLPALLSLRLISSVLLRAALLLSAQSVLCAVSIRFRIWAVVVAYGLSCLSEEFLNQMNHL